jgi:trimethylamine:corrinoid methyltransferase-like protein
MLLRAVQGVEVSEEALAEEIIDKAGPGGNFLFEKHTLKNLRKELFVPELLDKPKLEDIRRNAKEKARRIISTHRPEPLSRDVREELRKIIKEASRREMGS